MAIPNRRIKYAKGHLEFKLHPFFAFGTFILFLITIGGGVFLFVDANYKGKLDNREAQIERLSLSNSENIKRINALSNDSAEFISLKTKLRSSDKSDISPKEQIIIDSLIQAEFFKDQMLKTKGQQIETLAKQNNELNARLGNLSKIEKNNLSKTPLTIFIHDTITKYIPDTFRIVDTVYINESSNDLYYNVSSLLSSTDGFQDPTGFALGIVNWSNQKRTVDVTVIRPGETDSKTYKGISVGTSWTGTAANIRYVMTLVSLEYSYGDIQYRIKVTEVPQ